ncbi:MAG TPA: hypothetical protein VH394_16660, partial [Thermoanaerobaculia bacterium]|nr:hypothetical protein [Thermoanaerobaculia bacterium]
MSYRSPTAITTLALVSLLTSPLTSRAAEQQGFADVTEVVAVEVPVQVIRDGEPVRGLTADDFEIYDGRKKMPITGFEVLDLQTAPAEKPEARRQP